MQDLLLWGGVFVLSLTILVVASRFFTEAAEVIGLSLGMSPFAVGVLIVAKAHRFPNLSLLFLPFKKDLRKLSLETSSARAFQTSCSFWELRRFSPNKISA
jgi:hypothetical protein